MQQALKPSTPLVLAFFLINASAVLATGQTKASENPFCERTSDSGERTLLEPHHVNFTGWRAKAIQINGSPVGDQR
jgi:hypothetical protein